MIGVLFNRSVFKILTLFSLSPGARFLRKEIKEKTKLNNISLDEALNLLFSTGILKKERRLIYLDIEKSRDIMRIVSEEYRRFRRIPLNVYFSVLYLAYFLSKKRIDAYLFGSYAKLIFDEESDIDIAVVGEIKDSERREIERIVEKIERRYGKRIEIHYFSKGFYRERKDPIVRDIKRNGIRIAQYQGNI